MHIGIHLNHHFGRPFGQNEATSCQNYQSKTEPWGQADQVQFPLETRFCPKKISRLNSKKFQNYKTRLNSEKFQFNVTYRICPILRQKLTDIKWFFAISFQLCHFSTGPNKIIIIVHWIGRTWDVTWWHNPFPIGTESWKNPIGTTRRWGTIFSSMGCISIINSMSINNY